MWVRIALAAALMAAVVNAVGIRAAAATGHFGRPVALTVDDLVRPLGLAPTDVYFGWHLGDTRREARQSA